MKKYNILIGLAILVVIWAIISYSSIIDPFFLPGPVETFTELFNLLASGLIIPDIFATLTRTLIAFFIAVALGLPIGLFLGNRERIYRSFEFVIDFFRSTPATAIFPLFMLIFGINDGSKIAAAVFGGVMIIIFNTAYGVIHSKKSRATAAKLMGASKWQIFHKITFWESLPQTFTGLRNAVSLTFVIVIVTEMFIGTNIGLGHLIIDSQLVYNIRALYAAIVVSGVLGYLLNYSLLRIERKYVHWSGK